MRLNHEAARLVADLSHAQKQLYDQQSNQRHLTQKLESLQAVEQRCKALETQIIDKNTQAQMLKDQLGVMVAKADGLSSQVRDLELALAAAHAKLDAQQGMVTELRAYLDARERPAEDTIG